MSSGSTSFDSLGDVMADVHVRIAELAAARPGDGRLVAVGLGSCVGIAMFDEVSGAVALAHVFLPDPGPAGAKPGAGPGTYAHTAVPELVRRVVALSGPGGRRSRLQSVIVGGARMFGQAGKATTGGSTAGDVGERNVASVRAALELAGIPIAAEIIGGASGRTMRIEPGPCTVVIKQVGRSEQVVWESSSRIQVPVIDEQPVSETKARRFAA